MTARPSAENVPSICLTPEFVTGYIFGRLDAGDDSAVPNAVRTVVQLGLPRETALDAVKCALALQQAWRGGLWVSDPSSN